MARASDAEKAERLNRARLLLQQHEHVPEAVAELVRACDKLRLAGLALLGIAGGLGFTGSQ